MHPSTFEYLKPSELEMEAMSAMRQAAKDYAAMVDAFVHEGPDKTYVMRKLREVAMWVNVAITRQADGSPRNG